MNLEDTFGPTIMLPENCGSIKLISATPQGENLICYAARVSSKDQAKREIKGLLRYCLKHGHVSIFEQADMTVEITCPLAIAIQILRHRSFCFQQFSARYQTIDVLPNFAYVPVKMREQDAKNRQNSVEWSQDRLLEAHLMERYLHALDTCKEVYDELIHNNVAKELARFVLPEAVMTKLYMKGNVRSWLFYFKARREFGVSQYEHCIVAEGIYDSIFKKQFPIISEAFAEDAIAK